MKRREFIRDAAIAAAGAAVTACGLDGPRKAVREKAENAADSLSEAANAAAQREARMPRAYQPVHGSRFKLSWEPHELSLVHTFTVSGSSRSTTPDVLVKLEYDGFTGYGEASMPPYLGHSVDSVTSFLQKVNLRQFTDPFRLEEMLDYVHGLSKGDAPAKAAVDMALHDLFGKLMGQPLWRIWGENPDATPDTTFTIGMDTPEVMAEKTREAADRFKILKVKVGTPNDKEMISAVRSVTSLPIAVDANQGWSDRMEALYEIYWLKDQGVVMVEQPLPKGRREDTAWLRERSPLPIFADESVQGLEDVKACRGVFDGINIKLMKCGGLQKAREMMLYARASGLKVMLGCMTETSCGISAAAQISPGVDFADLDGNLLISNDPFEGAAVRNGRITLNNLPGLGLSIKK